MSCTVMEMYRHGAAALLMLHAHLIEEVLAVII